MTDEDEILETPLTGGSRSKVVRRGRILARQTGSWAPAVHALLEHLENIGFEEAPRVVGSGFDKKGREILIYVEGEVIDQAPWTDTAISKLGTMMRRLHDATAWFRVPENAIWRPWFGREVGKPDIIGHCDAAPWNIVSRNREPYVLVDWEVAGPVNRLTEIAMVAWTNAQLYDDDVAALVGLPDAATRMRQVRLFTDAYGLPATERNQLAYRIIEFAAQSAANDVIEQQIAPLTEYVPAPGMWGIAWQTRSVAWLIPNRFELEAALA